MPRRLARCVGLVGLVISVVACVTGAAQGQSQVTLSGRLVLPVGAGELGASGVPEREARVRRLIDLGSGVASACTKDATYGYAAPNCRGESLTTRKNLRATAWLSARSL